MDPNLQAAIEEMRRTSSAQREAAQQATTAANAATAAANASTAAIHSFSTEVRRDLKALRRDLGVLWRHVHSSDHPPPNGDPNAAPVEIAGEPSLSEQLEGVEGKTSTLALEMASLEGRMLSAVAGVEKKLAGSVATVENKVMGELKQQSTDMGVGESGWAFLRTKTGRREAIAILTLATTAIGLIAALVRGPSTPPTPPPPQQPSIVVVDPSMLRPAPAASR